MQDIMSKLVTLAKQFNIAVIVNHHTNKPGPGQPDLVDINRVRGSGAIAAQFRMIWGLELPDPKDQTTRLKVVKSNLSPFPESLGMIVTDEGLEWTEAPKTPEEFRADISRKTKVEEALDWLKNYLKSGGRPAFTLSAIMSLSN